MVRGCASIRTEAHSDPAALDLFLGAAGANRHICKSTRRTTALSGGTVRDRCDREAGVSIGHLERGATRHDDLVGERNSHRGLLRNGRQSKIRVESDFLPDTPVARDYSLSWEGR